MGFQADQPINIKLTSFLNIVLSIVNLPTIQPSCSFRRAMVDNLAVSQIQCSNSFHNDKIIACTENNMAPVRRKSREVRDGNGALGECAERFGNGHLCYCGRANEDWDDDDKAATEYKKYKARTLSGVERDYLDAIQLLEQKNRPKGNNFTGMTFAVPAFINRKLERGALPCWESWIVF